jgi:hypothetical protein
MITKSKTKEAYEIKNDFPLIHFWILLILLVVIYFQNGLKPIFLVSVSVCIGIIIYFLFDKKKNLFTIDFGTKTITKYDRVYEFNEIKEFIQIDDFSESKDGIYIYMRLIENTDLIALIRLKHANKNEPDSILTLLNKIFESET